FYQRISKNRQEFLGFNLRTILLRIFECTIWWIRIPLPSCSLKVLPARPPIVYDYDRQGSDNSNRPGE
ncbi:Hypothetical predicted protein, partial [Olea europaea subsp. europaea]